MEREIDAAGVGPARARELAGGGVAVLDAAGRVHAVIGWAFDRSPSEAAANAAELAGAA